MTAGKTVRVGCHSGFWGDTETAAVQLVRHGNVDYLVSDYLAEVTMSIMAAQKLRNPQAGYATDFVTAVMGPLAREIAEKKIKVVTNAGGVNPQACRDAVLKACEAAGVKLKVAVVLGDDLLPRVDELRGSASRKWTPAPSCRPRIVSMNAYLGGFPIARALAEGADVVITGRCVDSAVTLGALIHAFGWTRTITTRSRPARCAATSSNAAPNATAATSPIGGWCRTTTTWAFRSPRSQATAASCSASPTAPAA